MQVIEGRRVRVYYNLHKHVWSLQEYIPRKGWRVRHHVINLVLKDVQFKVSEAGRQRVIREQRKHVHAWAIGTLVTLDTYNWSVDESNRISYNPYRNANFMMNSTPVACAEEVIFTSSKQLFSSGAVRPVV